MIDTRFHSCEGPLSLAELCKRAGHEALVQSGFDDIWISGASDLLEADQSSVSFAASATYQSQIEKTAAAAVIVKPSLVGSVPNTCQALPSDDPYGVFIDILNVLYPDDTKRVAASSSLDEQESVRLEADVVVGRGAILGRNCEIGQGTVIGPNAVIGAGVTIGRNCVIGAGAIIECAHLGNNVVLQPGVVIGGEGFGFQLGSKNRKKFPQLGRVILQDNVEIGANSTVDRGTLGDTVIGEGSKIDNLVQIGHNCRIGRNCVICGMVGLSGSTILEDDVILGGGVGTAGHLTIGRGTIVAARGGITNDIQAGLHVGGFPAQEVTNWRREIVAVRRLAKRGR